MILTLPPIQLPTTGEFERHNDSWYAICTILYSCICTAHMYIAVGSLYIATFYKDRLFIAMYIHTLGYMYTHLHYKCIDFGGSPAMMEGTESDIAKRYDCILVYGSTTKGDVVKRPDCILVYGSTTNADIVNPSGCILVYVSTTKDDVKRFNCIQVYGSTTKGDVLKSSDCILVYEHTT